MRAVEAAALLGLLAPLPSLTAARPSAVPLEANAWRADSSELEFENYLGRRAMRISNGEALIADWLQRDGLIEFDLAFEDRRGFAGVNFRRVDAGNSERFYLRSHQSGNPDANQYTPIFNGLAGWQIYYGPQYSAPTRYRYGEWMRVSLIVRGDEAEVHLDGEPVLRFHLLREPVCAGISLWTNTTPAWFSNINVTEVPPQFELPAPTPPAAVPGAILEWEVSDPFAWQIVKDMRHLDREWLDGLNWTKLRAEPNGIANLARTADPANGNTVLARVSVTSEEASSFRFGFSDAARVYVDTHLIYAGDDSYGSRDYRFLGTVGLNDTLFTNSPGDRVEFVFAVREGFGGWAVTASVSQREE